MEFSLFPEDIYPAAAPSSALPFSFLSPRIAGEEVKAERCESRSPFFPLPHEVRERVAKA
jgi:hypothetical protein